jgi:hypothetical protein
MYKKTESDASVHDHVSGLVDEMVFFLKLDFCRLDPGPNARSTPAHDPSQPTFTNTIPIGGRRRVSIGLSFMSPFLTSRKVSHLYPRLLPKARVLEDG